MSQQRVARVAGGYAAPEDFRSMLSDLKRADLQLHASWQQSSLREQALTAELRQTQQQLRAVLERERNTAQALQEAEALMVQQRELAKQAYSAAFSDAQAEVRAELLGAQQAVERATASQRVLRARLRKSDERCAALQRECEAAKGARHHWIA